MKNIIKLFVFFMGLSVSLVIFANYSNMDVYGTNEKIASKIINEFGKEIEAYIQCHIVENRLKPECHPEKQAKIKKKIIDKIKCRGNFAYVDISSITYADLKRFITIDVVEKTDKKKNSLSCSD